MGFKGLVCFWQEKRRVSETMSQITDSLHYKVLSDSG